MSKKKKNLEYITSIVVRCTAMFHHRRTIKKLKRKGKKEMNMREQSERLPLATHVPHNNDNFNNKLDVLLTASPLNPSPHCPSVCVRGI